MCVLVVVGRGGGGGGWGGGAIKSVFVQNEMTSNEFFTQHAKG